MRSAAEKDRAGILSVVAAAFAGSPSGGDAELEIVQTTWARHAVATELELVASDVDGVLGHVLGSWGDLAGVPTLAVAPLCVAPARQGEGIGTALMTELLARADRQGHPLVLLLGNPAYYERFGFEPASRCGITYPPVGPDSPYFQVRRLTTYQPGLVGDFRYCWEMAP